MARNIRIVRLAQARRQLHQRIEHSLQIKCRAADDFEHVSSGGLLLQRFAQLAEQAGVLDRDDGLRGEVRDQLDLLVREGAHFPAVNGDGTDQCFFLNIGTPRNVRAPLELNERDHAGIALNISLLRGKVGDMNDLLRSNHLGERTLRIVEGHKFRTPP